jgi:hypothetical protein
MSDETVGGLIAVLFATFLVAGTIGLMMLARFTWRRLTGKKEPEVQSVGVSFRLSDNNFGKSEERHAMQKFAGELESYIEDWSVGKYDGDEFGGGTASLYFYGPSADEIWRGIEAKVRENAPLPPLEVTLIYGGLKASRKTISLSKIEESNKA